MVQISYCHPLSVIDLSKYRQSCAGPVFDLVVRLHQQKHSVGYLIYRISNFNHPLLQNPHKLSKEWRRLVDLLIRGITQPVTVEKHKSL